MISGTGMLAWVGGKAGSAMTLGLLFLLIVGVTGCDVSMGEPLYGNYNKSETTGMQRRSDVRACERRHQRLSSGPANRSAGLTNQRVEQCLESHGYRQQPSGR